MEKKPTWLDLIKEVYNVWISERPIQLAAALAYYSIFAFAPIIYIAYSIAGFILSEQLISANFSDNLAERLGPDLSAYIYSSVERIQESTSSGGPVISIISIIALLFAASGLFFQLQTALNTIWRVPPAEKGATGTFIRQRLFSFLMVIGVGLVLVVITLVSVLISFLGSLLPIFSDYQVWSMLAFVAITTLSFMLLYKILPNTQIAWRDVIPGAILSAVLILVGGGILIWYLGNSRASTALQAAGTVAVFLVMFYYMAQIFLIGALFSRVYAQMFGSKKTVVEETS
jgi:membrane protein